MILTENRHSRALRAAVAASALLLLIKLVLLPYVRAVQNARAELAESAASLADEKAFIHTARLLPARIETAIEMERSQMPGVVDGATPAAAQARLAEIVDSTADTAHVTLDVLQPLPVRDGPAGITTIPLHIEAESDLHGILTMLASFETRPLILAIDNLVMERRNALQNDEPAAPEVIDVRFDVTGRGVSTRKAEDQ